MRSPRRRVRAVAAASPGARSRWSACVGERRGGRDRATSGRGGIDVVQVNGLIDPSNAALITQSLRDAAASATRRSSSSSSTRRARSTSNVDALVQAIRDSPVPVAVWVGPSGGEAQRRVRAARARRAVRLGRARRAHRADRPDRLRPSRALRSARRRGGAASRPSGRRGRRGRNHRLSGKTASRRRSSTATEPTLGQFIVGSTASAARPRPARCA